MVLFFKKYIYIYIYIFQGLKFSKKFIISRASRNSVGAGQWPRAQAPVFKLPAPEDGWHVPDKDRHGGVSAMNWATSTHSRALQPFSSQKSGDVRGQLRRPTTGGV